MAVARMPVYDTVVRTDGAPATHLENSFEFHNRVAGEYWQQVRELVQAWLDRVDDEEAYKDLRGRLRERNPANWSAFFELYLHEMFRRAGYELVIHPRGTRGSRRPDFLIEGHGERFYLEAMMPGQSNAAVRRSQHRAAFLDTIQTCTNTDFWLSLDDLVIGEQPARGRLARASIDRWLGSLELKTRPRGSARVGTYVWTDRDWSATFSAIPRTERLRGDSRIRPLGIFADGEAGFVDEAPTLRRLVEKKAHAYPDLRYPLVLAIGTYIWDPDRWHAANAFYGHEVFAVPPNGATEATALGRAHDGLFGPRHRLAGRGVSAVLHVNQLQPSHCHQAEVTLWPHPDWPDQAPGFAHRIPAAVARSVDGALDVLPPPVAAAEHFALPDPWPAGEAFPRG